MIAISDGLFVLINNHLMHKELLQRLDEDGLQLRASWDTLISQTYANMLTIATFIANDTTVQSIFLQGKKAVEKEGGGPGSREASIARNALYKKVGPNWKKVQKNFNARQLHFHLGPGSTSFLRVHRPEKFGDNMDNVRYTIVDTNKEKKPRSGFETGRVYSGLRGVVPVSAWDPETGDAVHVGALEVGTSYQTVLNIMDQANNIGAGVLLRNEHVKRNMWPEFVKNRFPNPIPDCQCVAEAKSRDGLRTITQNALTSGADFYKFATHIVTAKNDTFALTTIPIRDYQGQKTPGAPYVGVAIFWRNINTQVQTFEQSRRYNVIYGITGFFIIEILLFFGIRLAVRRLETEIGNRTLELKASQRNLKRAQSVAQFGNWNWDINKGSLEWSDEIYRIFGYAPQSFPPTYEAFLKAVHPEDRALVEESVEKALTSESPYIVDHRIILPDGTVRVVHEQGEISCDKQGNPVYMLGTVQDITEQKSLEDELITAKHTAERTAEVKAEFLASMSHEIRTPMTGVMGFAELLMDDELPAESRKKVEGIKKAANALQVLINDILDLSKLDAGKMKIEKVNFHLIPLIEDLVEHFDTSRPTDATVKIRLELSDDFPNSIKSDSTRIRQILTNLIGNALKFTQVGSITVKGERLALESGEEMVKISVQDTGIGIKQETLPILFDNFTQADMSISRNFEGTGLGLSICKQLVTLMGGEIGVESRFGEGSTFWFSIPYTEPHSSEDFAPLALSTPKTVVASRRLNILVAEDNKLNQLLIGQILSKLGHNHTIAGNGKEAVEILKGNDFDLILMDVRMPVLSGLDATQAIRQMEGDKATTPIIALTADVVPDHQNKYLAAGMDAISTKPIDTVALAQSINRVLDEDIHSVLEAPGAENEPLGEHSSSEDAEASVDEFLATIESYGATSKKKQDS